MRTLGYLALFAIGMVASIAFARGVLDTGGEPPAPAGSAAAQKATSKGGPVQSKSGYDITPLSAERVKSLAKKLTPEEANIILRKDTERPFCGNLLDNKKEGTYACRLCLLPLFSSDAKFTSGTGWPSFYKPFDPAHIKYESDTSHGMSRDEIVCARCGGHLGHVFDDAPQTPTGRRYCLNSASLEFFAKGTEIPAIDSPASTQTAYFAGGCFWGVEDRFQQVPGVIDAVSGYMGGRTDKPTYKQVCYEDTGHAETVKVVFDPAKVTYTQLLEKFFKFHDPTQLNRQGPDYGSQYRSAIFATDDTQFEDAKKFVAAQQETQRFKGRKVVTQIVSAKDSGKFFDAEEYHQDYHVKHGGHCPLPEE